MVSYQPTMLGTRYMCSAGHYLAARAGFDILEAGGNAVDAGGVIPAKCLRNQCLGADRVSSQRQRLRATGVNNCGVVAEAKHGAGPFRKREGLG